MEWSFIKFLTWSFIKFFIFIQTWAQLYSTLRAWEDFPTELLILIPIWAQPELFQCSEWDVEVDDFHLFYLLFKFQFSLPHHLASSLGQCSALRDNFIELLILIFMPVLFVRAIMPNSIFSNAQLRMKCWSWYFSYNFVFFSKPSPHHHSGLWPGIGSESSFHRFLFLFLSKFDPACPTTPSLLKCWTWWFY